LKIAIDLSITKINQAGTAVYAASLIEALQQTDHRNQYQIFAVNQTRTMGQRKTLGSRTKVVYHDMIWHHVILPLKARRAGADLLFMPANTTPLFTPCPTVVAIHDVMPVTRPQNFTFWFRNYARVFMPLSARRSAVILTSSTHSKQDIVECFDVPPEKVVVTHLAANSKFRPISAEAVAAIKQKYGLDQFILVVGTLEPRKNIVRLIQAYALLRAAGVTIPLVHVGSRGWLYDEVFGEVERLGLEGSVRFLGRASLDDLVALYNAATVFVYPSLYEGFGIPVLEAMSCGCPTITSNLSSLPEVIGDAGIMIDPYNVEQIAEELKRVLEDHGLAEDMLVRGLSRANLFSWERCAHETMAAFDFAISQRKINEQGVRV
jgi:glycosyltransferase involved in cell wall biosynthesis